MTEEKSDTLYFIQGGQIVYSRSERKWLLKINSIYKVAFVNKYKAQQAYCDKKKTLFKIVIPQMD